MTPPAPDGRAAEQTISIVLVNKDDERLAATLEQLVAAGTPARAEVLVIDASAHRLDHVRDRFDSIGWIDFEPPAGAARSIADQRNEGIARSTGDVVVFLDANCLPEPGWLEALIAPISNDGEAIVAGRITSLELASIHDAASTQGAREPSYLEECACMNVAFRRDVFDVIGGFDPSLGYAEDFDLAWRARYAGYTIRFEPGAEVRHHFGGVREDLPRAFRYGVGRVRLYRKHPDQAPTLLGRDRYVTAYALYVLCLPLALVYPVYLLALAYPLVRNRRSRPFRTVAYHLAYALGVLSEAAGVRVLPGQRARP